MLAAMAWQSLVFETPPKCLAAIGGDGGPYAAYSLCIGPFGESLRYRELLIDHHKNIKGSPAAIILAALVARIRSSKLGRVERGLSHPRRLSTLSLPERDPHVSGKSLYECPHSQHASDAII